MDNKICVGYLTNIRDMFVVGSERCEGEALEYQNKFINALNYAIEFIDNAPTVEERPQGDLISREALKDDIENNAEDIFGIEDVIDYIDNAPTVPNAYMRGYEAAEREYKRPQGKWIFDGCTTYCSECGYKPTLGGDNYCPNCGAKMTKDTKQ